MMHFDINVIATGLAAPVAVLLVKTLLDFSLAHQLVKWFWWLPVRGLFRDHPPSLSGKWEQIWGCGGSQKFENVVDRHSYTTMRQFGRYLYAELDAKGQPYCFFGKIVGSYIVAEWYDKHDKRAYFGTAQLRIVNTEELEGKYVGHSQRTGLIGADEWTWKRRVA